MFIEYNDDFKFSYRFWHENTYIVTDRTKSFKCDPYDISKVLHLPVEDVYDIIEEFDPIYITTHGYNSVLAFKNIEAVERVVEWLNANLILNNLLG